jgi:hypothetical protein
VKSHGGFGMTELAHALVSQSSSVSIRSRGLVFPKGRSVRVTNSADIKYFKTDRQFQVLDVPVQRRKAAATKKAEAGPDTKADKKPAKKKKPGKKSGKK